MSTSKYLDLFGRILLAFMFFFSAYQKTIDPSSGFWSFVDLVTNKGMPIAHAPEWIYVCTIAAAVAMDLLGGILLVIGGRFATLGASILVLFTLIATPYFHDFWVDPSQLNSFNKNVAVIGGLITVAVAHAPECILFGKKKSRK